MVVLRPVGIQGHLQGENVQLLYLFSPVMIAMMMMMMERRKKKEKKETEIIKPLVASYDMPGIQWTYSIPGPHRGGF